MKVVFTALWVVVCFAVLLFGHAQWKEKITAAQDHPSTAVEKKVTEDTVDTDALLAKAKNWPDSAKAQLKAALKDKKPFKILFVGAGDELDWTKEASAALTTAYGPNVIQTSTRSYDVTTTDFVRNNNQMELAAEKAQLIIFEPLLLNDNAKVDMNTTLANLSQIMADVKDTNPDTTFILQPSYPVYGAKLYPVQVSELKDYAAEQHLAYLDHWTAWPDTTTEKVKDYLKPDGTGPNDQGNEAWAKFISDYLISN